MEVKTAAVPLPLSETICGLLLALSVMDKVAARLPRTDGSNMTEIVQVPPAANVLGVSGQVVVSWKSLKLVAILLMVRAEG
jgi:hypothetical protein